MKNINKEKVYKIQTPLVSVILPVYNAGLYIRQTIESILSQTYQNFEFIIIDDCSTDNSWNIVQEYAKCYKQIKVYKNHKNLKSAKTVTRAIALAKGDFLARMDADDIALPDRLEKQVNYLLQHTDTVALGGQCILIDQDNNRIGEKLFPTSFDEVYKYIFQFCPVQQPTFMIAKKRLPKNFDYYSHGMTPVEDIELLFKLFRHGKVENLPDLLLMYRIHGKNVSLVNMKHSFYLTLISRIRGVLYHNYKPTVKGIVITIVQAFIVLLLPQKATFTLYSMMKKIRSTKVASKSPALTMDVTASV